MPSTAGGSSPPTVPGALSLHEHGDNDIIHKHHDIIVEGTMLPNNKVSYSEVSP